MGYVHRWTSGEVISFAPGKIVCVGRNYAEHAKELNNPLPLRADALYETCNIAGRHNRTD